MSVFDEAKRSGHLISVPQTREQAGGRGPLSGHAQSRVLRLSSFGSRRGGRGAPRLRLADGALEIIPER